MNNYKIKIQYTHLEQLIDNYSYIKKALLLFKDSNKGTTKSLEFICNN